MRVAIFGAGYAGLTMARRLDSSLPADAELVVVDESGAHLIQHELHRIVRRPSLADRLRLPLSDLLDGATIRAERVTDVDTDAGEATLAGGDRIEYDVGAVCLGARPEFYDLPGVEEHATPLKRLEHARTIRREFLSAPTDGRVVVGGAGLSGVQVAGELAALAREEDLSPTITLVEQAGSVAPGFAEPFQAAVGEALVERGVEVRTDTPIEGADAEAVELRGDRRIDYDQLVWTGGIRGPDPFGGDRPSVRSTLTLSDRTFVLGDAARVVDGDGQPVPATAQAAIRAGSVAAENVQRLVEHDDDAVFDPRLDQFVFDPRAWLVSVGDEVIAKVGPKVLTGRPAKVLKTTTGARYMSSVGAAEDALDVVYEELGLSQ